MVLGKSIGCKGDGVILVHRHAHVQFHLGLLPSTSVCLSVCLSVYISICTPTDSSTAKW